jgi:hypothetical protein
VFGYLRGQAGVVPFGQHVRHTPVKFGALSGQQLAADRLGKQRVADLMSPCVVGSAQ